MHGVFPSLHPVPELAAVGVTPRPELPGSGSHRGVLRHRGCVVYAARNRAHPPPGIHQTPHSLRRGRRGLIPVVAQRVEGTLTPREQVTARGHRRGVKGPARNICHSNAIRKPAQLHRPAHPRDDPHRRARHPQRAVAPAGRVPPHVRRAVVVRHRHRVLTPGGDVRRFFKFTTLQLARPAPVAHVTPAPKPTALSVAPGVDTLVTHHRRGVPSAERHGPDVQPRGARSPSREAPLPVPTHARADELTHLTPALVVTGARRLEG